MSSFIVAFALLITRISGVMVFAPVLSGANIPVRFKASFTVALAYLMLPVAAGAGALDLTPAALIGELGIGMLLGLSLTMLSEALNFAGALIGMELSLSLANILDPMSRVETPLISQMLSLLLGLVVFCCGLDHMLLAAIFHTLAVAPLGHVHLVANTGAAFAVMASGIFFAGLQLASPLIAAAFLVEITMSLVGRLAPSLPVMVVNIPLKTLAGYGVMLGSLAVWPRFIASHWERLLNDALHMLAGAR